MSDGALTAPPPLLVRQPSRQHRCAKLAAELSIREQMVGLLQLELAERAAAAATTTTTAGGGGVSGLVGLGGLGLGGVGASGSGSVVSSASVALAAAAAGAAVGAGTGSGAQGQGSYRSLSLTGMAAAVAAGAMAGAAAEASGTAKLWAAARSSTFSSAAQPSAGSTAAAAGVPRARNASAGGAASAAAGEADRVGGAGPGPGAAWSRSGSQMATPVPGPVLGQASAPGPARSPAPSPGVSHRSLESPQDGGKVRRGGGDGRGRAYGRCRSVEKLTGAGLSSAVQAKRPEPRGSSTCLPACQALPAPLSTSSTACGSANLIQFQPAQCALSHFHHAVIALYRERVKLLIANPVPTAAEPGAAGRPQRRLRHGGRQLRPHPRQRGVHGGAHGGHAQPPAQPQPRPWVQLRGGHQPQLQPQRHAAGPRALCGGGRGVCGCVHCCCAARDR